MKIATILLGLVVLIPTTSFGQIEVYSDGSDGIFNPSANKTINLANAPTGQWDTPGSGAGVNATGIFDPVRWAVVFKFSSVNIPSGVTVNFTNHPSGAPVIWLVDGNVTLAGTISVNGSNGVNTIGANATPGPGGFRGGTVYGSAASLGGAGFGPGGGRYGNPGGGGSNATGGANGGPTYGNERILPLIGGSGGGAYSVGSYGGGAGAGAILIAAAGTFNVTGAITANAGSGADCRWGGGGGGGGIRLIGNIVSGSASGLSARPGCEGGVGAGGFGRIRIEANTISLTGSSTPNYRQMFPIPADSAEVWPKGNPPAVRVASVDGLPVPTDPASRFVPPGDVLLNQTSPPVVQVEATNVPITWNVIVQVTLRSGSPYTKTCVRASGDSLASIWTATLNALPVQDFVAIQARAYKP